MKIIPSIFQDEKKETNIADNAILLLRTTPSIYRCPYKPKKSKSPGHSTRVSFLSVPLRSEAVPTGIRHNIIK
jgi:hypothetical protein